MLTHSGSPSHRSHLKHLPVVGLKVIRDAPSNTQAFRQLWHPIHWSGSITLAPVTGIHVERSGGARCQATGSVTLLTCHRVCQYRRQLFALMRIPESLGFTVPP